MIEVTSGKTSDTVLDELSRLGGILESKEVALKSLVRIGVVKAASDSVLEDPGASRGGRRYPHGTVICRSRLPLRLGEDETGIVFVGLNSVID